MDTPDPLMSASWHTSSYSANSPNTCVEVAAVGGRVGVRDTTRRAAGHLAVRTSAWAAFVAHVKRG